MTKILGLTGSIGMGKTTAAHMLRHMGCGIFDSDYCVKKLLEPYGAAFETVALSFPEVWDKKKRNLNKLKLADLIFNDEKEKSKLEKILHPLVRQSQDDFILKQTLLNVPYVVLDIPLLFETRAEARLDHTIVVTAPDFIQRQRVLKRKGMSEQKFQKILQTQMLDGQKQFLADFVVQTGLGKAYSYRKLQRILREISNL